MHLAIYGSRARGDARPDSDLDVITHRPGNMPPNFSESSRSIPGGRTPSPQPSPPGRGSFVAVVATAFPLPEGEGQGEGLRRHTYHQVDSFIVWKIATGGLGDLERVATIMKSGLAKDRQ